MEEAVVKQGGLYLQLQQTFGKKWKKFWGVLYRESSCSSARLELLEGAGGTERPRRAEGGRRLVRLSDCVHVAEAGGDTSCPKDTVPFLLDTTERRFLLAADAADAAEWIQRLCELAFPRSREEPAAAKEAPPSSLGTEGKFSMEENSLYSSRGKAIPEQAFEVTVRVTPSSQRCCLRGRYLLRAGEEALELRHLQSQELLASWPYRFLRRFGRDKVTFSFEAGRRCASGEGNFEFDTRQGNEIFQAIEAAIEVQRGRGAEEPRWGDEAALLAGHARTPSWGQGHEEPKGPAGEVKGLKAKPGAGEPSGPFPASRGADLPYAEPCDALRRPAPPLVPDKGRRPGAAGLESEYAVPFDTIAKSFLARQFVSLGCPHEGIPEPLGGPREVTGSGQQPPGRPREVTGSGQQPPGRPREVTGSGQQPPGRPREVTGSGQQPPGRPSAPKPEHIYDEPEGLSGLAVYDEPQEVKGDAWRLQAAPEEPPVLGCPYNPQRDDYAVPKRPVPVAVPIPVPVRPPFLLQGREWLGDSEYDNVALRVAKKRNLQ